MDRGHAIVTSAAIILVAFASTCNSVAIVMHILADRTRRRNHP